MQESQVNGDKLSMLYSLLLLNRYYNRREISPLVSVN